MRIRKIKLILTILTIFCLAFTIYLVGWKIFFGIFLCMFADELAKLNAKYANN